MSYILDALKRANADRERERGAVPGLHAHTAAVLDAPSHFSAPVQMLVWAVAALGAVGLGALAVHLSRPAAPTPTVAIASPATQLAAPAAPPQPPPPPVEPAPAAAPTPQVSAAALAAASAALRLAPPAAPPAAKPASAPAPARAPATVADTPASSTKPDRIYTLNELPSEVRAQLPAIAISGASYSSNPAQRLLIVNGNVVQERGAIAPELVLEQIGETSAVLRFREYRYRVGY
jgi:general secretion pathway protein B